MASGDGLGRVFNIVAVADGVLVKMLPGTAVTFVGYLSTGDTYTVQEAKDSAGTGAQNLAVITRYFDSDGVGGAWSRQTQAAAATVTNDGTAGHDCSAFTIRAEQLSDTYRYVKCTSTGAGVVYAIVHDLLVQRTPQNLPALVG